MSQVSLVRNSAQFESLRGDWDRLAQGHWMRSLSWQSNWIDQFSTPDCVRILVATRSGMVIGILPLAEQRRVWTGRTLVTIGSGKACLDDLGILADPADQTEVAESFAKYLFHDNELSWDYMDLDGVRDCDPSMICFERAVTETHGVEIDKRVGENCWSMAIEPGADGFHVWPKRLRSMMRKARQERIQGEFEVQVATDCDQALAELSVIKSMHQSRWKSKGIQGCFSDENFSRFLDACVRREWSSGSVCIAVLRWGTVPAAGSVCFQSDRTLHVYVTSMAPEFSEHKPGWKLNGFLADYAQQVGCTAIDFMRGDEIYKQRLGAEPQSQSRWLIASPRLRGRMHRTIYEAAREIKNYLVVPTTTPTQNSEVLGAS